MTSARSPHRRIIEVDENRRRSMCPDHVFWAARLGHSEESVHDAPGYGHGMPALPGVTRNDDIGARLPKMLQHRLQGFNFQARMIDESEDDAA